MLDTLTAARLTAPEARFHHYALSTDTILDTDPTTLQDRPGTSLILVTAVTDHVHSGPVPPVIVGTIQNGIPFTSERWLINNLPGAEETTDSIGVRGALVNPEPAEGCYYREFDAAGERRLLRYEADGRFAVVAGAHGAAWALPDDYLTGDHAAGMTYVEVAAPAGVAVPTPAAEAAEDPTLGHGEKDAAGALILNPARTEGTLYVLWEADSPRIAFVAGWTDGAWYGEGSYSMPVDGGREFVRSAGRSLPEDPSWARLVLDATPAPDYDPASTVIRHEEMRRREEAAYERFNEELNTLAEEKEWCSEYESIVEPLGMTGRQNQERDWDITINADITIEDSGPSSNIDSALQEAYGFDDISSSNLSFRTSITYTVRVPGHTSEDSVRDSLSYSEITDLLNTAISEGSVDEVHSYDIRSIEEADD